jgi:tRNA G10  N-methylase Trm11
VLESAYVELEARHETYLESFESDNEDDKTKVNELNHDITVMYNELCKSRSLCEDMKERVKAERASEKKSHYNEKGQTKGAFETSKVNKLDAASPLKHCLRVYESHPYDGSMCLS